jgi:hypothetical protein
LQTFKLNNIEKKFKPAQKPSMNFNYTRGQLSDKTKENNPEYPEPPNFFSV